MRAAFIKGLIKAARKDPRVMLITGDLGYRFLEPFAEKFPERFLNIGVAESNLVTVTAGLSTVGFVPFIYSIATFASMRAYEQIRTDIVMQKLNVKIVGIGAGLAYNKAGPTHHSMEDIALMRTLPGMTIIAPVDTFETEAATEEIAKQNGPCYLRLERNPVQSLYKKLPVFRIGKGREIIKPAGDRRAVILATGTKIGLAREALEILKKKKIFCPLYAFPTIVPLDSDLIDKIRAIYPILITIEEHRMNGGFGTAVMEYLAGRSGRKIPKVVKIGLKDEFTPISADYNTLMKYHGMMPGQIADKIAIAVTD